jgi:hypothetical protein
LRQIFLQRLIIAFCFKLPHKELSFAGKFSVGVIGQQGIENRRVGYDIFTPVSDNLLNYFDKGGFHGFTPP